MKNCRIWSDASRVQLNKMLPSCYASMRTRTMMRIIQSRLWNVVIWFVLSIIFNLLKSIFRSSLNASKWERLAMSSRKINAWPWTTSSIRPISNLEASISFCVPGTHFYIFIVLIFEISVLRMIQQLWSLDSRQIIRPAVLALLAMLTARKIRICLLVLGLLVRLLFVE